jgi:DNA-binding transcriptional LysR family regulator
MNLISLDIRMLRSLISVVDTGSITETARRLGRTQPAISLQIQRLEDITGKVLFQHEGRRMALTPDGDMVLAYAKSILRLHDELLSRLSSPEVHGHVVLGTPDLYAAYMLPSILSVFKEAFPRIQVELRCALSTPTVDRVQRGEVDVALVTRMNNFTGGLVIHQEQLVWIVGEHSRAQFEDPVRLALLPPGNIYREHAINHLERAGRKWQIACVSESVSGLQAAVFAGMAITVLGRCALVTGMRELTPAEGFPTLPKIDLLLYKAPGATSPAIDALHDYLAHYVGLSSSSIDEAQRPLAKPPPNEPARKPEIGLLLETRLQHLKRIIVRHISGECDVGEGFLAISAGDLEVAGLEFDVLFAAFQKMRGDLFALGDDLVARLGERRAADDQRA